jgi:hypothetical protein
VVEAKVNTPWVVILLICGILHAADNVVSVSPGHMTKLTP